MYNSLNLFEFEKEAKDYSDKTLNSAGIPYELTFTNGIVFCLVFPKDKDLDYAHDDDLFLNEDGSFIHRYKLEQSKETTLLDCSDCSEFFLQDPELIDDKEPFLCKKCVIKLANGPDDEYFERLNESMACYEMRQEQQLRQAGRI